MILNSQIWRQMISEAKALSAGNAALLRAIDRAVIEIERSRYWSFDGQTLRIQSTTSQKLYVVDSNHTCEAQSKTCKHHVARRLMLRYTQHLGAAVEVEAKRGTVQPVSVPINQPVNQPVNRACRQESTRLRGRNLARVSNQ